MSARREPILHLYAVLGRAPAADLSLGKGLGGAPVQLVRLERLFVAVSALDEPAEPTLETLRLHAAVVGRLAALAPALVPSRFGEHAVDVRALRAAVARRAPQLREALARVAGCAQMTLTVYGDPDDGGPRTRRDAPAPAEPADGAGPGARYLAARRREALRAASAPELASLRTALDALDLVRAERVERGAPAGAAGALPSAAEPPALRVHHLIRRDDAARYARCVRRLAPTLAPLRVLASGPSPAYAFVTPEPLP